MSEQIENLKYNELKSLAAEKGLDASGTKEDLIARLKAAGVSGDTSSAAQTGDEGNKDEQVNTPPAPRPLNESQEKAEDKKAERALREDARKMKEHLEKQPKVSTMIPFEAGENPESGKKIPFHCNLNGYKMDIPRGVYVEVPLQIAELIKERLESEGKIGSQWRIDRDQNKLNALN